MKTLLSLIVTLLIAAPLYAEQALVLTEIEQIQEKIWYLQRDLAAQKSAIDKQQQNFSRIAAETKKQKSALETHSAAMAETLARQQKSLQGIDATVQSLQESVTALARELDQQTRTQMQQAEKSGTQEGLLQGMREEFAASQKQTDLALAELQKQTDLALAELQKQLAESRAELAALKTNQGESYDRLILYGGGAALALMVLLTIVLALRSGSSRRHAEKRELPTRHEL